MARQQILSGKFAAIDFSFLPTRADFFLDNLRTSVFRWPQRKLAFGVRFSSQARMVGFLGLIFWACRGFWFDLRASRQLLLEGLYCWRSGMASVIRFAPRTSLPQCSSNSVAAKNYAASSILLLSLLTAAPPAEREQRLYQRWPPQPARQCNRTTKFRDAKQAIRINIFYSNHFRQSKREWVCPQPLAPGPPFMRASVMP